jgi:hypothetical protein
MQNEFFGNHQRMVAEIEAAWSLYHHPGVSNLNRMHLRILQLAILENAARLIV